MAEKTKTIRQSVIFAAAPHEVYELLMDSEKHAGFSDASASISRKVGGRISAYDGSIEGKNLDLVADKLIVQQWRMSDWPEGWYSTVKFRITKSGRGAKLYFIQTGVPSDRYEDIGEGWKEYYWRKMKAFLK